MNIVISIIRQSLDLPALYVEGFSQKVYQFIWDTTNARYSYRPESQFEVDDLMHNQGYFAFTVSEVSQPATAVLRDVKEVNALSAALPGLDKEELDAVMSSVGLKTQTNDSNSIKVRIIDAFLNGTKYNGNLPRIAE